MVSFIGDWENHILKLNFERNIQYPIKNLSSKLFQTTIIYYIKSKMK